MNEGDMTLERLKKILTAYGANPSLWPADDRAMAEAFVAASPIAKELVDCARELDIQLDAAPAPNPASASFMDRLANIEAPKQAVVEPAARAGFAQQPVWFQQCLAACCGPSQCLCPWHCRWCVWCWPDDNSHTSG